MKEKSIGSIAIVINPTKNGAEALSLELATEARSLGMSCKICRDHPIPEGSLEGCDLCCVIGGDGTILGVVTEAVRAGTLILGVNLGKLGFLATYTPDDIRVRMQKLASGDYCTDSRALIRCHAPSGESRLALNDVVIKSRSINLIALQVCQDEKRVADYSCDGLIFATPTGSTAYNLSAGGPILHPQNRSLAMTPICPHTLSNRSFLFPDHLRLQVKCDCERFSPGISVDGRHWSTNGPLFPLDLAIATEQIKLVHDPAYSHFRTLRNKLNWV
jgi:NAD+ kinase